MRKILQNYLFIILGWFFIILGVIGVILPVLPTTPFLIVALAFFSKSSPKFHKMLLNNAWFGSVLKQWEENKTLSRQIKYKISLLVILTFAITIIIYNKIQLLLLAIILLFFIWRIKEPSAKNLTND
ncbi:MAG: YbaN family protein [Proteobacteria bacterium]|nr:YbaN family protein [Pseudomonadota bacterium]